MPEITAVTLKLNGKDITLTVGEEWELSGEHCPNPMRGRIHDFRVLGGALHLTLPHKTPGMLYWCNLELLTRAVRLDDDPQVQDSQTVYFHGKVDDEPDVCQIFRIDHTTGLDAPRLWHHLCDGLERWVEEHPDHHLEGHNFHDFVDGRLPDQAWRSLGVQRIETVETPTCGLTFDAWVDLF